MARRKKGKSNATQAARTDAVASAKDRIVEALRCGASLQHAAEAGGIHRNTLWAWRGDDEEFARECELARSEHARRMLGVISSAAGEGDWRAAAWWLEKYDMAHRVLEATAAERELAAKQTERPSDEKRTGEERRRRLSDLLKGRPS